MQAVSPMQTLADWPKSDYLSDSMRQCMTRFDVLKPECVLLKLHWVTFSNRRETPFSYAA